MGPIIKLLRDAGAKEVHIRVASPPLKHPVCRVGMLSRLLAQLAALKLHAIFIRSILYIYRFSV
jgi:amidophosphoribosyltransferase